YMGSGGDENQFVFTLQEVSCKHAYVECNMDHVQVSILVDTVYKYVNYIPLCTCLIWNL
uniref:Uncharacterized protein n=1 Tax=Bos indicus x Bos taurus TaxID=30522 RepID=A0A4W2C095_BOBOX